MKNSKTFSTQTLARLAIVATIYYAMTRAIAPLAYGEIQFRISEVLLLLCFYDKRYSFSLIVGCLLANLWSPLGAYDLLFGTLQTVVSVAIISWAPNLFTASLAPLVGCIFIGYELNIVFGTPILIATLWVMLGEFVVVTILGYPLFKLLERNETFMSLIKQPKLPSKNNIPSKSHQG